MNSALRTTLAAAFTTATLILTSPAVQAQFTAIADDFSNTGSLTGSIPDSGVGNWAFISGTSGAITTSSGRLNLLAAGTTESSQVNFSSTDLSTGTIYIGFDFTPSSSTTIGTSDTIQSIVGFRSGTALSGTTVLSFGAFRPSGAAQTNSGLSSTSTSQLVVGLFTGSSLNASSSTLSALGGPISLNATTRIVLGFDLTADTASLWTGPRSIVSTSANLSGITTTTRGVFVRQGSTSTGDSAIDNFVVTQDFATASAIPEPSTTALLAGLATLSLAFYRRRSG
jgi:hypothetical protein